MIQHLQNLSFLIVRFLFSYSILHWLRFFVFMISLIIIDQSPNIAIFGHFQPITQIHLKQSIMVKYKWLVGAVVFYFFLLTVDKSYLNL